MSNGAMYIFIEPVYVWPEMGEDGGYLLGVSEHVTGNVLVLYERTGKWTNDHGGRGTFERRTKALILTELGLRWIWLDMLNDDWPVRQIA